MTTPPAQFECALSEPDRTRELGAALAQALAQDPEQGRGFVVALLGDLGAGKTSLAKAAIASVNPDLSEDDVVSPTFVLAVEYPPGEAAPVLHVDAYRLEDGDALEQLGYGPLEDSGFCVLIEWAERVDSALPADRLEVELEHGGEEGGRQARLTAHGARSARVLALIQGGRRW